MYPKLIGKRHEKGITQQEMADFLGISKNNYFLKEKGKLDFNLTEVRSILKILDSEYNEIFFDNFVTENSYKCKKRKGDRDERKVYSRNNKNRK